MALESFASKKLHQPLQANYPTRLRSSSVSDVGQASWIAPVQNNIWLGGKRKKEGS
jgi:hypothetical protein